MPGFPAQGVDPGNIEAEIRNISWPADFPSGKGISDIAQPHGLNNHIGNTANRQVVIASEIENLHATVFSCDRKQHSLTHSLLRRYDFDCRPSPSMRSSRGFCRKRSMKSPMTVRPFLRT